MDKIIPIKKSKVLIVDDHPIVREGLIQLINRQNDLEVLKAVEDAETALATVKATRPDIILVDLSLKGTGGLELIKQINDLDEAIPVLVLSMHDEALYAERSLRAGARGYIMKQEATNRLL